MAATLQSILGVTFNPTLATDIGSFPYQLGINRSWTNGTIIDTSDKVYAGIVTIVNSGTPTDIDLSGSLLMVDGSAATFAKITAMYARHMGVVTTDDANIVSIGAGSNPFISWLIATGDGIKLHNRGQFYLDNPTLGGYAVTGGTGDILRFAAAAGTNVQVLLGLVGRSA